MLVVSAEALSKLSDADIASAANTQDFIATNRALVQGGILAAFAAVVVAVTAGTADTSTPDFREGARLERQAAAAARDAANAARVQKSVQRSAGSAR